MSNTNVIVLGGNLGADPEYRANPKTQKGVLSLTLATKKHRWNETSQDFDETVVWSNVKMFGNVADRARQSLSQGDEVTITGELCKDQWVDKNTGENRSAHYVTAHSFNRHLKKAESSSAGQQNNHRQPPQVAAAKNNHRQPPQVAAGPVITPAPGSDRRSGNRSA